MKKKFIIYTVLLFAVADTVYAQNNNNPEKLQSHKEQYKVKDTLHFYFKLGGGYALPLAPATLDNFIPWGSSTDEGFSKVHETVYPLISEDIYQVQEVKLSLGKGINIHSSFGIDISKHISAEIGAGYNWGSIFTAFEIDTVYSSSNVIASTGIENKKLSSRMWTFDAAIVLHEEVKKNKSLYLSLGTMVAIPAIDYQENISGTIFDNPPYTSLKVKYYGGVSYGAVASGGMIYKINKSLEVFGEIKVISLSCTPPKAQIIKYTVNGVNKVDSLPPDEVNVNLSESSTFNSLANGTHMSFNFFSYLKTTFPFSSWGINVGVKYNFAKGYYRKRKTGDKENK
jgi:hypothetical protein